MRLPAFSQLAGEAVASWSLPIALAFAVTACSPHDPRIPKQVSPPTVPNAPAATSTPDVMSGGTNDAGVAPTGPSASADAGAVPSAPVGEPPTATSETPTTNVPPASLGDSFEESKRLLEEPAWGDAATLTHACERAIARAKAVRDRFRGGQVPADETLTSFDRLATELDTIEGYASLMFNVSPDKSVRDVAEACRNDLAKFRSDVSLDRSIFDALSKVSVEGLDPVSKHFTEKSLRDFRLAGVDKDEAARQRISEINEELTRLSQDYQKNVNSDTRSISVDPAALDGLPDDWKAAHVAGADGKVTVTTDYPDLLPFLTYAADAPARKALANASAARGYPVNADVLKKILTLRQELAKLIGFPTFAALDLTDKMAGTTEVVAGFLDDAKKAARPRIDSDLATLLAAKKKIDKTATVVEVEDRFYLMQQVRKDKYNFDAKTVREYLAYDSVRDGILALYGELFGISFTRRVDAKAWDPSVEAYEVSRNDKVIGRFFLDMHPRADKYKHAAMFPIQTGLANAEGTTRLPWASLVCNFPGPDAATGGLGLMDHKDVVTFFHEFGHLIHHLLAQNSPWLSTSGINVEWDFVEAPSQLLEEWAWDPKVLARFAKNAAGKTLPARTVDAMKKAEEFGKGVELARQLFYAAYSFHMHTQDVATLDLEAFTSAEYAAWSPYPRPPEDRLYANFAHLIGYKSAYYTYQWSLAIAKDLFGRFKAKGLLDPAVAADYRTMVLEPGGTDKAENLIKKFLGRDRNLDAYRDWITK